MMPSDCCREDIQMQRFKRSMGLDVASNNHIRDDHYENHSACVLIAITSPNLTLHMKGDRAHTVASLLETYTHRSHGERMKRRDSLCGKAMG